MYRILKKNMVKISDLMDKSSSYQYLSSLPESYLSYLTPCSHCIVLTYDSTAQWTARWWNFNQQILWFWVLIKGSNKLQWYLIMDLIKLFWHMIHIGQQYKRGFDRRPLWKWFWQCLFWLFSSKYGSYISLLQDK